MARVPTIAAASLLAVACSGNPVTAPSGAPTPYPHRDPVLLEYSATPRLITRGQSSALQWRGEGFGVLQIEGVDAVLPLVGSLRVTPEQTTTYVLVTSGLHGGGSVYHLTVAVNLGQ
jgi:hypothetical protein